VQVLPESWHRTALVIRNENLLRDPKRLIDRESARKKLESAVIAFVGCSIGSRVVEAVAGDLRPLHVKVADYKAFHISNANRVHLTYEDFGINKAQVIAEYLHVVDPFMSVSVFSEGMHEGEPM
ncbi:MAG: ThiF family adenylyltransferase, partial [Planctomycetes bacterium]|nr:ThiF family adenylyltransferase [Planctomycetota bacterium]